MALGSTIAKNNSLAACYGDAHSVAAGWPNTVHLALFAGNPATSGVELDATGGYIRLAIANTNANFAPPANGQQANAVTFTMATSTGGYNAPATHWAYVDAATAGNVLDSGPLAGTGVTVATSGQAVQFPAGSLVVSAG